MYNRFFRLLSSIILLSLFLYGFPTGLAEERESSWFVEEPFLTMEQPGTDAEVSAQENESLPEELSELFIEAEASLMLEVEQAETGIQNRDISEETPLVSEWSSRSVISNPEIELGVRMRILPSVQDGKEYYPLKEVPETIFTLFGKTPGAPLPGQASVKLPAMPVSTTTGVGSFGTVELAPGTYSYTVKETAGTAAFIQYDDTEHIITVTVNNTDDDNDGYYDYVITADSLSGNRADALFENAYLSKPFTVRVGVTTPNPGDEGRRFIIRINTDVPGMIPDSSLSLTFNLSNEEEKTIYGLPVGTECEIVGEQADGYTVTYDPSPILIITEEEGIAQNQVMVNYLGKDSVSVDLNTWLLLYGYSYKDDGMNTYYYYPNTDTYYKVELIPPAELSAWQTTRTNRALFAFSGQKFTNKYRSLRMPFSGISFTADMLVDEHGDPVNEKEFVYTVRQTDENYSYIDYDIRREYQSSVEYKVYIRVYRDSDGRLQAEIEPVGTVTSVPMFEDEYRATSLSVAKSVSGKGASTTQEFRVRVTLERRRVESDAEEDTAPDSDDWVPLRNWQFVAAYGTITTRTGSDGSSSTFREFNVYRNYRTASDGSVTLTLKHRDYIMLHGIPDGIRYSIEEADYEFQNYWPQYSVAVGSKEKSRYNEIVNIDADGQRIINCVILNVYGKGDPYVPGNTIGKLFLPKGTVVVEEGAFAETKFISVICNEGLKEIREYAFQNCKYLSEVHFPKSIRFIDDTAFIGTRVSKVYGYKNTEAERFAIYNRCEFIPLDKQ